MLTTAEDAEERVSARRNRSLNVVPCLCAHWLFCGPLRLCASAVTDLVPIVGDELGTTPLNADRPVRRAARRRPRRPLARGASRDGRDARRASVATARQLVGVQRVPAVSPGRRSASRRLAAARAQRPRVRAPHHRSRDLPHEHDRRRVGVDGVSTAGAGQVAARARARRGAGVRGARGGGSGWTGDCRRGTGRARARARGAACCWR